MCECMCVHRRGIVHMESDKLEGFLIEWEVMGFERDCVRLCGGVLRDCVEIVWRVLLF